MPPCSVALSGDYSCLRGGCTEPQRGKCLETGINLFNLALFLSLAACCLSLTGTTEHILRHRVFFFFFFAFCLFPFHFCFSFFLHFLCHIGRFHMCVCIVCVSASAQHFLLSDSTVIGISSCWASEHLRLALLSSSPLSAR